MRRPAPAVMLAFAALSADPAAAQDGQAAFLRKDYAAARAAWLQERTPEAMFGLGILDEAGIGTARDPIAALDRYLAAARLGHAEAQFNVATMLEAGIGTVQSQTDSVLWYSRAAANGNAQARLRLAQLYQAGDGVPRNRDLARAWLSEVNGAEAQGRLAALASDPFARDFGAPNAMQGARNGTWAELAWTAAPGPRDSRFHVEVVGPDAPIADMDTRLSAIALRVPAEGALAWRVSRISDDVYAAGDWQVLGNGTPPKGRIRILARADALLAKDLAAAFRASGLAVALEDAQAATTTVGYGFRQDAALARSIAAFLPALTADDAVLSPPSRPPGEVTITLAAEGS